VSRSFVAGWVAVALAATVVIPAGRAAAATFPVDDSATLPHRSSAVMRWRSAAPNPIDGNIVDGTTVVTLVLNTAPFLHRVGRIYMLLPEPPIGPVSVDWTTQGRLLPGSLVSGGRTLIYAGPITMRILSDTMAVSVHADGSRLSSDQDLDFHFEIDVE